LTTCRKSSFDGRHSSLETDGRLTSHINVARLGTVTPNKNWLVKKIRMKYKKN